MDFKQVIKRVSSIQARKMIKDSKKPIVVQLFSHFCSACGEAASPMQQASDEVGEDVQVIAVDGDFNQAFANELNIDGFPTAVAFKNGERIGTFEGAGETSGEYTKFFAKCLRPKPLKKTRPSSKPRQKPKPKPKPKAVKKKKVGRPKGSKNKAKKDA